MEGDGMSLFLKIGSALMLVAMIVLLWPTANHWLKHGPRGSGDDWRAALLALGGVVAFVVLLILMVKNA